MRTLLCPFAGLNLEDKGTEKAPEEVRKALKKYYLSEKGRLLDFEFEEVELGEDILRNYKRLERKTPEFKAAVGGDHSLTFPLFRSLKRKNKDLGLIVLDAHPDCQTEFYPPTYEDFVRTLLERGTLSKENLILFGLRNWSKAEYEYLKEEGINYFSMAEIFEKGFKEVSKGVMYKAKNWDSIYLSVDIDVVDPAFAPGTAWKEPGGITSRQLIALIKKIDNLNLRFVDLMEINPGLDRSNRTVKLGAKLLSCLSL